PPCLARIDLAYVTLSSISTRSPSQHVTSSNQQARPGSSLRAPRPACSSRPSSSSTPLTVRLSENVRISPFRCTSMAPIVRTCPFGSGPGQPYRQNNHQPTHKQPQPVDITVPENEIHQDAGRNEHVVHCRQLARIDPLGAQV